MLAYVEYLEADMKQALQNSFKKKKTGEEEGTQQKEDDLA
jgi:hypothetical protein